MSIMGEEVIVISSLDDHGQYLGQLSLSLQALYINHPPSSLSFILFYVCHPFDGFHWIYLSACSRVDVGECKD